MDFPGGLRLAPPWATGPLTCVGLHVLQKVVIELELDPTGATGVRFYGDKRSSSVRGRTKPEDCQFLHLRNVSLLSLIL